MRCARVFLECNDRRGAGEAAERAFRLSSGNVRDGAFAFLCSVLDMQPSDSIHFGAQLERLSGSRATQFAVELRERIESAPFDVGGRELLSRLYGRLGRCADQRAVINDLLRRDPFRAEWLRERIAACVALHAYSEAASDLERLVRVLDDASDLEREDWIRCLVTSGQDERALEAARKGGDQRANAVALCGWFQAKREWRTALAAGYLGALADAGDLEPELGEFLVELRLMADDAEGALLAVRMVEAAGRATDRLSALAAEAHLAMGDDEGALVHGLPLIEGSSHQVGFFRSHTAAANPSRPEPYFRFSLESLRTRLTVIQLGQGDLSSEASLRLVETLAGGGSRAALAAFDMLNMRVRCATPQEVRKINHCKRILARAGTRVARTYLRELRTREDDDPDRWLAYAEFLPKALLVLSSDLAKLRAAAARWPEEEALRVAVEELEREHAKRRSER